MIEAQFGQPGIAVRTLELYLFLFCFASSFFFVFGRDGDGGRDEVGKK